MLGWPFKFLLLTSAKKFFHKNFSWVNITTSCGITVNLKLHVHLFKKHYFFSLYLVELITFRSWKVDLYTEKDGTPVSPCSETTICLFKMSISNQQTIANTTNLVSEVLYVNQQCTQLQHKTTCSVPLNLTSKWQFTFNIAYMYHPEFNLNLAFFSPMSINLMT